MTTPATPESKPRGKLRRTLDRLYTRLLFGRIFSGPIG